MEIPIYTDKNIHLYLQLDMDIDPHIIFLTAAC